jgi:hypothetical chaperone protein
VVFVRHVKVADDIGTFRIRRENFRAPVKQAVGLIKIDRMGHVRGDADISLARFGNRVHLDGEQHWDMLLLQRAGQQDCLGPTPAVPKDDDSRVLPLKRGKVAVTVGIEDAEDVAESLLSGVIAEHLYIDSRGVTVAQLRGKLHFGMLGIVVFHEAAYEPDNDYFVEGGVCRRKGRRQAVCRAQWRETGRCQKKQPRDKLAKLASFHATAPLTMIAPGTPQSRIKIRVWTPGCGIMERMQQAQDQVPAIGIDFGTTNSTVARASGNGHVELVAFPTNAGETFSFRSVLYLEQIKHGGRKQTHTWTGPSAIEHYLAAENKGRLIQSLKSYLSDRTLTGTAVFGRHCTLEDLISRMLADLRRHAERTFQTPIGYAMVGRPVRFVGAESEEDQAFALARLRQAFAEAGFERVDFEMEPVAAAYAYEATLHHDELILIGDFGGGTSDFSLLHVGPGVRKRGRKPQDLLGNSGVGLAGDAFDARLVRKLVSPALGSESFARSLNKVLPAVPAWIYANLERWHYLSFLRTANVVEILKSARLRALEPEKIEALITLIDEDLGYHLHQAVQRVKFELSHSEVAEFHFRDGSMDLHIAVTRAEFEGWIADELHSIEQCVDSLLESSGISRRQVDRVFLTGGSSLVPAVRCIFKERFGEERIRTGDEFISVARGLALRAEEVLGGLG